MARKRSKKKTSHHRRGRKMGAGSDTMELFLGAAGGALAGYLVANRATLLPSVSIETKGFVLLGGGYFLPKMVKGNFGLGLGLGMAASGAIITGKSMGLIAGPGVYAGPYGKGQMSLVGRPSPRMLNNGTNNGLPVLGKVGAAGNSMPSKRYVTGPGGVFAGTGF